VADAPSGVQGQSPWSGLHPLKQTKFLHCKIKSAR
jgi:hypothetical protein